MVWLDWWGTCMHSSREGVYGNNAVQFQSCDCSSYCTALGENGCTDMVSCQLQYLCSYQILGNWPESFEITKQWLCKTACCTIFISSGITRDGRPLQSSLCTLVQPAPSSGRTVAHNVGTTGCHRPRWLSYSPLDPRFAGSIPARIIGFFQSLKILSMTSFRREVKPWVPCHKFTACKRT